jgi:hypothetical protein
VQHGGNLVENNICSSKMPQLVSYDQKNKNAIREKCEKSHKSQYCSNGQLQTKIVRKIEKQVTDSVK